MSRKNGRRRPTLGPHVCAWIERNLVHAEGDYLGQPFKLRTWQKAFLYECYELRPDGSRQYRRVGLGLPKGNGKTELAAAIALAELDGPVVFDGWASKGVPKAKRRSSPDIPVAACSLKQANTLFGAAKTMATHGKLKPRMEAFTNELSRRGTNAHGTLYRVAAVVGANDGGKPSFYVADELHEWEGTRERVHLVLSNGCAKRDGAWELWISTAGANRESMLGRICAHGEQVAEGKIEDPDFLFRWYQADTDLDLDDPAQLEQAVRQANPAAGDFLPIKNILRRYDEIAEHEFRRYYLNQWTSVPEAWMPPEMWDGIEDKGRTIPDGAVVTLGFDGGYNRDSTALVACSASKPYSLQTLGVWERPEGKKDWVVDKAEVFGVLEDALGRWEVISVGVDDTFGRVWSEDFEALAAKDVPVMEWPTRSAARMAPACAQFWGAVKDGTIVHDGDEDLKRHIANCRTKTDRYGPRIVKEHKGSTKKIDAAVAAIVAHDLAVRNPAPPRSIYEDRGVTLI